jgi:NAD(P)-dependent dehydrogenase (short-subunit alcohol dehydrogenase family)
MLMIIGCDSGFGLLAAVELSRLGFYVMSTCMTEAGIERLKGIVGDVMLCDVTNEEQVRQLFEMCDQKVKCTEMKVSQIIVVNVCVLVCVSCN